MICQVFVTHRQYSSPGPCENQRDVRLIAYDGGTIRACQPHRAMVERGHHLTLVADENQSRRDDRPRRKR